MTGGAPISPVPCGRGRAPRSGGRVRGKFELGVGAVELAEPETLRFPRKGMLH